MAVPKLSKGLFTNRRDIFPRKSCADKGMDAHFGALRKFQLSD